MYHSRFVSREESEEFFRSTPFEAVFSKCEQEVYKKLVSTERKRQWVMGRMAVKSLINELAHGGTKALDDIEVHVDELGKPFVSGPFHVSISHKGDLAIGAVSSRPIGVDMETYRPVSMRMQKYYLATDEQVYFADKYGDRGAIIAWTIKESYLKALGTGFILSPLSFTIAIDEIESNQFSVLNKDNARERVHIRTEEYGDQCVSYSVLL